MVKTDGETMPATGPVAAIGADLEALRSAEWQEPIKELSKLLSQNKRVFLMGAGCSKCAGLPLMDELTKAVLTAIPQKDKPYTVLDALVKEYGGGAKCTIEDYMSELVDLMAIAVRRSSRGGTTSTVTIAGTQFSADDLKDTLARAKEEISQIIVKCDVKIHNHRQFIRAVHGRLQAGKSGPTWPVDYFTLNYDTLLEDALSLERVPLADGFNGGVTGWWHGDAYRDAAAQARVFKVHGSIDWCLLDDDVFPRRVRQGLIDGGLRDPVMIWPAGTKYREAQRDPYAQIMDMMRTTLRPAQNSEVVLSIAGYAFGDSHINYELDRALRESDGRLTAIVFTSEGSPPGIVGEWVKDASIRDHVRVHAKRGFFHGTAYTESKVDLPWWKFEVLARLLGGEQ